jgi:TolB-like protein
MTTRRLATIVAADVASFSAMMERDEEGTAARIRALRLAVIQPALDRHHGRLVKTTGDGFLAEFASPVEAVRSALAIQDQLAKGIDEAIRLRIGINLGDIIIEDDGDVIGDGVNVAARLEQIAEPGGVCLSGSVHEQVAGKIDRSFENCGEHHVKNIARPIRVYALAGTVTAQRERAVLPLPDKPSIAVLPFQNMSGDPEQEYFADGVVEEIITALSRFQHLFVIARNSSFTYKGRITGQLIDASTGAHLWADRFEGALEDIFDLQDKVTANVVGAVAPKVELAEIERAKRKPTENLNAYDHYLRGIASFYQGTGEAVSSALNFFYRAIELDPSFSSAYGMAARCYTWRKANGWRTNEAHEIAEMERLARRAVKLGRDDAFALCTGGFALAHLGDLEEGAACIDRAAVLNPSLAWAWYHGGWVSAWRGEPEEAIERLTQAMRLSPLDQLTSRGLCGIAFAHFLAERYGDACIWAERGLLEEPNFVVAVRILGASYAMAGRLEEAKKTIARLRQLHPAQRISNLKDWATFRRPEHFAKWVEALRAAGLPE